MSRSDQVEVTALVEQAIDLVEGGRWGQFRTVVEQLSTEELTVVQPEVESRLDATLVGCLGERPAHQDVVKLSHAGVYFISNFLTVEPLQVEVVIRRFYGEPSLVHQAGMTAELLLPLELALVGFLRLWTARTSDPS